MDLPLLLQLLAGHQPFDEEERAGLEGVVALLGRAGEGALARSYFEPGHVTASAFVRWQGRMLLIHHLRLRKWLQPGGHVEPFDASIESAARREVEEETGLTNLHSLGLLAVDIHEIPAARGEPTHLHFDLSWGFEGSGAPIVGDGVGDARWVSFADVSAMTADSNLLRGTVKLGG